MAHGFDDGRIAREGIDLESEDVDGERSAFAGREGNVLHSPRTPWRNATAALKRTRTNALIRRIRAGT